MLTNSTQANALTMDLASADDGGQHEPARDARRPAFLEAEGFAVLRFWNGDVLTNPRVGSNGSKRPQLNKLDRAPLI